MDYSRVSLTDAAGRVLGKLRDDIAGEMQRIVTELDGIRANPSKTHAEKQIATHQYTAAIDALEWAFNQVGRYYTPVGGDGS